MSSGVEFEEDKFSYTTPRRTTSGFSAGPSTGSAGGVNINRSDPKMVQWLMRHGLAKSPGAAQGVLIFVIIINVVISYIIIKYIL